MTEELADTKSKVEREQILQKYGLVEPKLTSEERLLVELDENDEFNRLWDKVIVND